MRNDLKQKIHEILKRTPYFWRFASMFQVQYGSLFTTSRRYWEDRYAAGGDSGAGSLRKLAEFKAEIINNFVRRHDVRSLIEFGCGDGNQLVLASYEEYVGLDVSKSAVHLCKKKFKNDETKRFFTYDPESFSGQADNFRADASLSLDVIYHLVEEEAFKPYMEHLFQSANRYVIIYSSNFDRDIPGSHVKHRKFTAYVEKHFTDWGLLEHIENRYPAKSDNDEYGSFSEFLIYERKSR